MSLMKLTELIDTWEKLGDKYDKLASNSTDSYAIDRLLVSADILRLCATQLKIITDE